jgi:hypothetical protein
MFKLGEIRPPNDKDFDYVKDLCINHNDWDLEVSKTNLKIWVKNNQLSSFRMIKIKADLENVNAGNLFDVLLDGEYSRVWDSNTIESSQVCHLSPCSDINYYAMKSPKPLKSRDFVVQRCWLDFGEGNEKLVFNHSVSN